MPPAAMVLLVPASVRPFDAMKGMSSSFGRLSRRRVGVWRVVVRAEHVVGPLLIADHVLRIVGRRVPWRLVWPHAGRYCSHGPIDIAVAEEGQRVALAARAVEGAVGRGEEIIVGPALQQLAAVHDKGAGKGRRIDPFAALRAD